MVFVLSALCHFGRARGKTCVHVNAYPIAWLMCGSSPSVSESCPYLGPIPSTFSLHYEAVKPLRKHPGQDRAVS